MLEWFNTVPEYSLQGDITFPHTSNSGNKFVLGVAVSSDGLYVVPSLCEAKHFHTHLLKAGDCADHVVQFILFSFL